jgi:ApaG protein
MGKKKTNYSIKVAAQAFYLEEQSDPAHDRYVFAYTVLIQNQGNVAARLLSRHWIITDANSKVEEVRGEGVVGEQPYLRPGEGFQYTSGAILDTSVGSMKGSYQMLADDGVTFDAEIPPFVLSIPRTLH